MAAYYSTNYTKQFVNVPSEKIPAGEQYGVMRVAYDDYTFVGDVDDTDTIDFMKIPKGARIIDIHFVHSALDGGTIDLGWSASDDGVEAGDADGFLDGYNPSSAGSTSLGILGGRMKKFSAECTLRLTVKADAVVGATDHVLQIMVLYVVD
tara:strand:+ start:3753 stop:4205 length:453 start_codon:yes stop_codon:yes gene_type:complete